MANFAGRTRLFPEAESYAGAVETLFRARRASQPHYAKQEDSPPSARQRRVVRYIFSSSREGERLVATIYECNSVPDAHEALIDVVMTYMAPKLPRCETKGLEIGDVCFGSHGDISLSVIFARFNILAEAQSVGPEPTSVDEFARNVDSLVLQSIRKNDEQIG